MRHRVHGRKLGRTTAHRKALFRNQLSALFTHERIVTTLAKAKELRPLAERMVTLARTGTLPARRKVLTMVPNKVTVARLFEEIAPRFMNRDGGYTRIMRLGRRRGDGAELAIIEFVDYELKEKDGEGGKKTSFIDKAKGMFGAGAKAADADAEVEETVEAAEEEAVEAVEAAEAAEAAEEAPEEKPKKKAKKAKKAEEPEAEVEAPADEEPAAGAEEPAEDKKDE